MSTQLKESLLKCRVEGNVLFLPPISNGPLSNYNEVKTALLNAGAKYKKNTFVFPNDAQPYIDKLLNGDKVNIKKEFQFFATPDELADKLVELACFQFCESNYKILEPSAGNGAIVKAIHRQEPTMEVEYCELMDLNKDIMAGLPNTKFVGDDFMQLPESKTYHRIVANPPFSKGQDIEHLQKMYNHLERKGIMVCITSIGWMFGSVKKVKSFRQWLDNDGNNTDESWNKFSQTGTDMQFLRDNGTNVDRVHIEIVEPGSFKESGTMVKSAIVVIEKL